MATIAKHLLSGSTNGLTVSITGADSGAADTIHTAVAGTGAIDEIWLWANNIHTSAITLEIEWGETGAAENIHVDIDPNETVLVAPGWPLQNGLVIKGFTTGTQDVVNVHGYVNRITD